MAFTLNSESNGPSRDNSVSGTDDSSYRISAEPVVSEAVTDEVRTGSATLPRTYGTQSLCLLARDPHTLFAYWDIDWTNAFGEQAPRERKVHLRILNVEGLEQTTREVEPMSGYCLVEVPTDGASYTAEIGYFQSGKWNSIATSPEVNTPSSVVPDGGEGDLATIPFHLSFPRMLDVLRVPKQEGESLTEMLADLRARAASEKRTELNAGQRELVDTIDELIAHAPAAAPAPATLAALWTRERLEQILGFRSSSPQGLGGSSQS